MKKTPYQKAKQRLIIGIIVFVLCVISAIWIFGNQEKLISYDTITKTKIYDCDKFNKVVFSSGEVLAYGNEKSEYENGEIGE